ncbi:MAG: hypothetical protein JW717_11325 [Marinilabiliaceae bacterium]|nr:hypothetical protein [Marinilabiliaceae bacterium]
MILTVTLNPAIDKILILRGFEMHKLHRLVGDEKCNTTAGGKGVNIALGLKALGNDVIATGFAGGYTGHKLCEELRDHDVTTSFIFTDGLTRTNSAMLDVENETLTEINDFGSEISSADKIHFLDNYRRLLNRVEMVVIAGSLPPGIDESYYYQLIKEANDKNIKVALHVSSKYTSLYNGANPFLINPDMRSNHEFLDRPLDGIEAFINAGRDVLIKNRDTDFVVFTHRLENIVALTRSHTYVLRPKGLKILNMFGYCDAYLAGFIYGYLKGFDTEKVLRYASAVGLTNVEYVGKDIHDLNLIDRNIERVDLEILQ